MNTAIITGSSAGLGLRLLKNATVSFPEIEEYWLIARNRSNLENAALPFTNKKFRLFALDLCSEKSFEALANALSESKPSVSLLINNSGCGYLNNIGDGALGEQTKMIDLNVRALTAVTHLTVPYMHKGSRIINISSIASFCPNPRMTVYSSTKAYVSSFSMGLRDELKKRGISVTAVCPGPMNTDFIYL